MKDFSSWGIKRRVFPEFNYNALWVNLKTFRLGSGQAKQLPPEKSEFYDVSLGTKCNLCCPFCYVGASGSGVFYKDICEKAKQFFGKMDDNSKSWQIAIGVYKSNALSWSDSTNVLRQPCKNGVSDKNDANGEV